MLTPTVNERVLPDEMEIGDGLRSASRDADRGLGRAVLEQHAELVAAQARQRVAFAQPRPQHDADLAQQLVAGRVAAGVVDELELVEIEIEHRVVAAVARAARQRACAAGARTRAD